MSRFSITNDDLLITHSTANESDRFSDHFPITIEIAANARRKERNSEIFSFCKCDFKGLSKSMIEQPFQQYCYSNINVNTKLWYEWVFGLIKNFTPRRTIKKQIHAPWITQETSHSLNKLETMRRKYQKSDSNKNLKVKLKSFEEKCYDMQETDRLNYEKQLFSTRRNQKIFKYLKSLQKENYPPRLTNSKTGMKASTDSEKANLFNVYFSNIVTDVHYKFFVPWPLQTYGNKALLIDRNSICLSLQSINIPKSKGPDQLPPILFKRTSESN